MCVSNFEFLFCFLFSVFIDIHLNGTCAEGESLIGSLLKTFAPSAVPLAPTGPGVGVGLPNGPNSLVNIPNSPNGPQIDGRGGCPLCDTSVYSYCSDRLAHDACCCNRGKSVAMQQLANDNIFYLN